MMMVLKLQATVKLKHKQYRRSHLCQGLLGYPHLGHFRHLRLDALDKTEPDRHLSNPHLHSKLTGTCVGACPYVYVCTDFSRQYMGMARRVRC